MNPPSMYELFCKHVYLPALDRAHGLDYAGTLTEALANQRLAPEVLVDVQERKLTALLEHAETSTPFYRSRFKEAGVHAKDIRTIDDLRALPLLTKQDIAEHADEMRSASLHGRLTKGVTSGSTGISLRFEYDARHEVWIEAVMERGHGWWGLGRSARRLVLWGRPVVGGWSAQARAWLKYRLRNTLSFNTFEELDDRFLGRVFRALMGFHPGLVYGYGSSLAALAQYMDREGLVLPVGSRPRLVEYTGDHMYDREKATTERVLGAPIASLYASSEAGGLSFTCPNRGLHMSADHILVEFLREDGRRAGPGEQAEVVVTTLNNFRMPLIRYRVGDVGSYTNEACPCGVTLPLMNLDVGKVADCITTSTKQLVSSYTIDYINKHLTRTGIRGIRQFLVEQTGLDDFVLHVVREEPFNPESVVVFKDKMREYLGESIRTEVRFVDAIPISASGKRRWFKKSIPRLEAG